MTRYDAIVVGAGPAGTTAAVLLAKAGWSVAVVEESTFPRRKVCGEFISATSMPLLHRLGIGEAFSRLAGPEVLRVGLYAADTMLDAPMPSTARSSQGWGRALGREHLDGLLLDEAVRAGAILYQPVRVAHIERNKEDVICTLEAKTGHVDISAHILIHAAGSWQRDLVTATTEDGHRPSDLLAFKAHFKNSALPEHLMPLLAFPGGYGGMVHSDQGRTSLSCCIRRDQLQACRQAAKGTRAAEAVLQHIFTSTKGVRMALQQATLDGAWLSVGPIKPGMRTCYENRVFRVGNAAGEAHPVVAEGISMAMQSSWLLCQRLIADKANTAMPAELQKTGAKYSHIWQSWFAPRIRAAAFFASIAMQPRLTSLLLPMLQRFPVLLTFGARLSGKTKQLRF